MRIGIDLTASAARPSGIDRFLTGLVGSLAAEDDGFEYVLFVNVEDRERLAARRLPARFRVLPLALRPRAARLVFQQAIQPVAVRVLALDVLHSPTFIMPLWLGRAAHVLTIHDMTSFLAPETHAPIRRGPLYERAVRRSMLRANMVTVPSHAVRDDVVRLVPEIDAERVRVTRFGIEPAFHPQPPADVARTLARLAVPTPYVLFTGNLDPRKNVTTLLDAYARLVDEGAPEHLVLAGQPGWSVDGLEARLDRPGLQGRVHRLGWVPEADLPALYAGARLFAFPSLLEGFGFPPLEAMATGVPVVAALGSSLGEHLSGAAELVPARDVAALASAMRRLLADEELRRERIAGGFARVACFRWDAFAAEMRDCYVAAAAQRRGLAVHAARAR